MSIYLFGSSKCKPCEIAKEFLKDKEIDYKYIDVDDLTYNDLALELVKIHCVKTLPTLIVQNKNNTTKVDGFSRGFYEAALFGDEEWLILQH